MDITGILASNWNYYYCLTAEREWNTHKVPYLLNAHMWWPTIAFRQEAYSHINSAITRSISSLGLRRKCAKYPGRATHGRLLPILSLSLTLSPVAGHPSNAQSPHHTPPRERKKGPWTIWCCAAHLRTRVACVTVPGRSEIPAPGILDHSALKKNQKGSGRPLEKAVNFGRLIETGPTS